ncbi:MAG: NTP transferase domain-containing protein [Firmicutes bacterium]|nr:NTP transferase domain-containing protein [Bacillota bacterium]
MKAIIMAGGEGSRLRPLTCDRPKPMVPLMNRPLMEHIVALLKRYGLKNIGVTLQYLPEQIRDYFGDGRDFGVTMQYFVEDSPLGTAGSVKNAGAFLDETFLVISGDALTDFDLQKAIAFHRQKGGVATLVLTSVATPLEYGVVITEQDGRIVRFLEKPSWSEVFSDTVNTGIYILEPEVLRFIPEGKMFDFARDLFPLLMQDGYTLYGYVAEGYWCDIGSIKQYQAAHLDVLQGKVRLELLLPEAEPGILLGEDVVIEPGARLAPPVFVGSGSRIESGAHVGEYSVLGSGTQVASGASVKRSILFRNTYVGPGAEVRGAVLCNRVRVMSGASLFEGAVVGDDCVLEENVTVKPDVKIWPHKRLESASIVSESVIWGTKPARSLFGSDGIRGRANLEITPELVAKLCTAYGSLLPAGSSVTLSSDDWKASRMLKTAALAGLLAAGLNVRDLGVTVTPVARQAVEWLAAAGGLHVQLAGDEDTAGVRLVFLAENGFNLSKGWERKIEQVFYREDFRRLDGNEAGEHIRVEQINGQYREKLLQKLDRQVFSARRRKIVLAWPTPWLAAFLAPLLAELNCEVITLSSPGSLPRPFSVLRRQGNEAAEAVRRLEADLGALLDANAEQLILFDRTGRMVADELLLAVTSAIVFRTGGTTLAVPVTAPAVIEELAGRHKGRVVRTKADLRAVMEALAADCGREKATAMAFACDAIASLAGILAYLAAEECDLSALVDDIPPFYVQKAEVACPWDAKGAVMRRLIEETRGGNVELLDGVKVRHGQGWALVLPDSDKPVYRVYSEGNSMEAAAELADLYIEKIKQYQKELKK